jgi:hypothetical protein
MQHVSFEAFMLRKCNEVFLGNQPSQDGMDSISATLFYPSLEANAMSCTCVSCIYVLSCLLGAQCHSEVDQVGHSELCGLPTHLREQSIFINWQGFISFLGFCFLPLIILWLLCCAGACWWMAWSHNQFRYNTASLLKLLQSCQISVQHMSSRCMWGSASMLYTMSIADNGDGDKYNNRNPFHLDTAGCLSKYLMVSRSYCYWWKHSQTTQS